MCLSNGLPQMHNNNSYLGSTNDSLYKDGRIEAGSKNSLGGRARRCVDTQTIVCNSNVREDKILGKKILIYLKTLHMKKK